MYTRVWILTNAHSSKSLSLSNFSSIFFPKDYLQCVRIFVSRSSAIDVSKLNRHTPTNCTFPYHNPPLLNLAGCSACLWGTWAEKPCLARLAPSHSTATRGSRRAIEVGVQYNCELHCLVNCIWLLKKKKHNFWEMRKLFFFFFFLRSKPDYSKNWVPSTFSVKNSSWSKVGVCFLMGKESNNVDDGSNFLLSVNDFMLPKQDEL